MKEVIVYDGNNGIDERVPFGADAENTDVTYDGEATDAKSAVEDIIERLDGIVEGTEITSGIVVDGVGELAIDMGNIKAGININGITVDKLMKAAFGTKDTISILHLSDSHGGTACINGCINKAKSDNEVTLIIHTGDIGNRTYNRMLVADCEQPVLGIWGNHDAKDTYNQDEESALTALRALNRTSVNWGGQNTKYWYKDVVSQSGKTIRFIALDEYDYSNGAGHNYTVTYTQTQMEWFLNLLYTTDPSYFLVVITHQPLSTATKNREDVNSWTAPSDTPSSGVDYSGPGASWVPSIIKRYIELSAFSGTFDPMYSPPEFSVSKDFSQLTAHATFICYLCGHTHFDWHDYLASYPNQLMLCVTRADSPNAGSSRDDIARSEISWAANKVTFDLGLRKVIVERIGSMALTTGGTRERIVFDF